MAGGGSGGGGGGGPSAGAQTAMTFAIAGLFMVLGVVWLINTWRGVPTFATEGNVPRPQAEQQFRPVTGGYQQPHRGGYTATVHRERRFADCDNGYWQDAAGWCHGPTRWVPGP